MNRSAACKGKRSTLFLEKTLQGKSTASNRYYARLRRLSFVIAQYLVSLAFIVLFRWANGAIANPSGETQKILVVCLSFSLITALYFIWEPKLKSETVKNVTVEALKAIVKALS